jgi:hypothetical protein
MFGTNGRSAVKPICSASASDVFGAGTANLTTTDPTKLDNQTDKLTNLTIPDSLHFSENSLFAILFMGAGGPSRIRRRRRIIWTPRAR